MGKKLEILGNRYGKLLVIEEVDSKTSTKSKKKHRCVKCVCDCGNTKIVQVQSLVQDSTKSCGCGRYEDYSGKTINNLKIIKRSRNPKNIKDGHVFYEVECLFGHKFDIRRDDVPRYGCMACFKERQQKKHGFVRYWYFNQVKRRAAKYGLEFTVSIEYLNDVFIKQDFRCVYTNRILTFDKMTNRKLSTASLDRIDSTKGYIEGNVQWVHKEINFFKVDYSHNDFVNLCKEVANNVR